jgi:quercetin dioxygenase-like cupin family protein
MEKHTYLRTHDLNAEHVVLDLGEVVTEMHGGAAGDRSRAGVTLARHAGMSVVLNHLHAGARLQEHATPGAATVQVLDGRVRLQIAAETLEVPAGRLAVFDAGVRHAVEALEDSTLLITVVEGNR